MCVIITRPEKDSLTISDMLNKQGISNFIEPMFQVIYPLIPLDKIEPFFSNNFQALIVTSANAIEALSKVTAKRDMQILVISDSSANLAKKLGFTNILSAQGNVDSLIKMIYERFNPHQGKLGYLSGRITSRDLKRILMDQGYDVDQLEVYHTMPRTTFSTHMQELINNGKIEIILFYSNKTVEIFYGLAEKAGILGLLRNVKAITISQGIANSLKTINWDEIAITSSTKPEIMVKKIIELYK